MRKLILGYAAAQNKALGKGDEIMFTRIFIIILLLVILLFVMDNCGVENFMVWIKSAIVFWQKFLMEVMSNV